MRPPEINERWREKMERAWREHPIDLGDPPAPPPPTAPKLPAAPSKGDEAVKRAYVDGGLSLREIAALPWGPGSIEGVRYVLKRQGVTLRAAFIDERPGRRREAKAPTGPFPAGIRPSLLVSRDPLLAQSIVACFAANAPTFDRRLRGARGGA